MGSQRSFERIFKILQWRGFFKILEERATLSNRSNAAASQMMSNPLKFVNKQEGSDCVRAVLRKDEHLRVQGSSVIDLYEYPLDRKLVLV